MFDKFRQNVGQAAAVAKWKADQMVRQNKAQQEISNAKREIAAARDQIAGVVFDMRQRGEAIPSELESACATVDGLMAHLAEHEAQLATINAEQAPAAAPAPAYAAPAAATKPCPNCHTSVPASAMFCTTCGYNFAAAPAAPAAEKTTVTCPSCHFEVPAGSAFCPNCGGRVIPA
jgi:membrane protease subunit (stomatin/prohibitin family)